MIGRLGCISKGPGGLLGRISKAPGVGIGRLAGTGVDRPIGVVDRPTGVDRPIGVDRPTGDGVGGHGGVRKNDNRSFARRRMNSIPKFSMLT